MGCRPSESAAGGLEDAGDEDLQLKFLKLGGTSYAALTNAGYRFDK